jgi:predicted ATP-grasp superfamily ATP-dependent carboligase
MNYVNPALIIGSGVNALGILRNLGRLGIDVYCVDESWSEAFSSRYCKGYAVIPGIGRDLEKFRRVVQRFTDSVTHAPVIFPANDMAVLNYSIVKPELNDCLSTVSDSEVIETLVIKRKFYRSLQENRVPHPVTLFPNLDCLELEEEILFPVFIKPSFSPLFFSRFGRKGFVAYSRAELRRYLNLVQKHGIDVIVQQIIVGPDENHIYIDGYFDVNSQPVILFARRCIRKPSVFDNSSTGISIPLSDVADLKDMIVRYLTRIKYRGIFGAEFKKDLRDDASRLLEVNPRSWWYNSFPTACGVNIILTSYLEAIGEEITSQHDYETGVHWIWLLRDFRSLKMAFFEGNRDFRDWISPYSGKKAWMYYAKDDPKPFIKTLSSIVFSKFLRLS